MWVLSRTFPGATVEIRKLSLAGLNRIEFDSVVLKSRRDSQETLLTLAGGSVAFTFEDLLNFRLGEVRLNQPVINASPRLLEAFAPPPGKPPAAKGPAWTVRHLVCDYGELTISDYGYKSLAIRTKFAFNFENFSPSQPEVVHSFLLWNLSAATGNDPEFLTLDLVRARFQFGALFEKRAISRVSLSGGSLTVGKSLREIFAAPGDPAAAPKEPWVITALSISRVEVLLDDERAEVSDLRFAINTALQNVPLSQAATSIGNEGQVLVITNLEVPSPYDPLTAVVTLDTVALRFTIGGLLRREIEEVEIRKPTIHLGPDLFWYMEDMEKRFGNGGKPDNGPGWKIRTLSVRDGRLTVGSSGRPQYGLPLNFRGDATDIAVDNLAALKLNTALEIPPDRYVFDSYQIEFTTSLGKLAFSYPPEKNEKNLVGTIQLDDIRWRQYRAEKGYLTVTFDRKGINGLFGARAYRGTADGGFSFFFDAKSPWIGWVSGENIDLKKLTDVISPQNFQMTGPLKFKLQMDAQGKNIDRVLGEVRTTKPGKLVIGKLDDLMARIPDGWNKIKQSSTRIALETLRDFAYTKGTGNFWFVQSQGILQLKLQGPQGSRNFDVVLHADDFPKGQWKLPSTTR